MDPIKAYEFMSAVLDGNSATAAHELAGFEAPTPGARRKAASRLLRRLKEPLEELRRARGLTWEAMKAEIIQRQREAREAAMDKSYAEPEPVIVKAPEPSPQLELPGMKAV